LVLRGPLPGGEGEGGREREERTGREGKGMGG